MMPMMPSPRKTGRFPYMRARGVVVILAIPRASIKKLTERDSCVMVVPICAAMTLWDGLRKKAVPEERPLPMARNQLWNSLYRSGQSVRLQSQQPDQSSRFQRVTTYSEGRWASQTAAAQG